MCTCAAVTQLQLERDELYKSFSQRIQKVQHKGDVKNELLERKVKALTDSLEEMQAQLCSVLSASNMDQTALDGITNKIEVLLYIPLLFPCFICHCVPTCHLAWSTCFVGSSVFNVCCPAACTRAITCVCLQKKFDTSNDSIKNLQYKKAQIAKVCSCHGFFFLNFVCLCNLFML